MIFRDRRVVRGRSFEINRNRSAEFRRQVAIPNSLSTKWAAALAGSGQCRYFSKRALAGSGAASLLLWGLGGTAQSQTAARRQRHHGAPQHRSDSAPPRATAAPSQDARDHRRAPRNAGRAAADAKRRWLRARTRPSTRPAKPSMRRPAPVRTNSAVRPSKHCRRAPMRRSTRCCCRRPACRRIPPPAANCTFATSTPTCSTASTASRCPTASAVLARSSTPR